MSTYAVSKRKASTACKMLSVWILGAVLLAGCTTTSTTTQNPYPQGPVAQQPDQNPGPQTGGTDTKDPVPDDTPTDEPKDTANNRSGLTPPFMDAKKTKRIAIILPFSARSERLRAEAGSMMKAAELSLFDLDSDEILLIALDSGGTASGARQAAKDAVSKGAEMILGPVLSGSVKATGEEARRAGVPVVGFSTDTTVAGKNVYLLSFPPEAEVKRITEFVGNAGATKFAFLGPTSAYGRRVLGAYRSYVDEIGGTIEGVETYAGNDITVMQDPAERIAKLYADPINAAKAEDAQLPDPAYHAILLPEGGTQLRSLAPLLTYFDDSLREVQLIGTGLWNRDEVAREPAINGGVFAAPDQEAKALFTAQFDAAYGEEPSTLASLAYDAVNIASFVVSTGSKNSKKVLTDPAGFYGVDGLVRFNPDGTPDRGLAVYQVRNGRFSIVSPAPRAGSGT